MKHNYLFSGLVLAVVLQVAVLCGMLVKAALPLWTGTEIRVNTVPVDPRSLFRGNYARLNYDFSQLPESSTLNRSALRNGEKIYVSLQPDETGRYSFADAALNQPLAGVYLRGRIASSYQPYRINYGIEAFFAPKDKALALEKDLRSGGTAVLMVTSSGSVALQNVESGNDN